jgi:hypothetical protein
MLLYVTLGSNDIPRAKIFYDATLATLGLVCHVSSDEEIGYRYSADQTEPSECRLWVLKPVGQWHHDCAKSRNPRSSGCVL